MDTAPLGGQSGQPGACRLPRDVVYELLSVAAVLDPPIRKKYQTGGLWSVFPCRANVPRERLGPDWSRVPFGPSEHEERAALSTYRLWDANPTLGWIRLTHVNKEWRAVGLSMPQLWGDVFPIYPHAAETIFARSRDQPLSLDMDLVGAIEYPRIRRPDYITAFSQLAQQNIQRARVLTVNHFHDHFADWDIKPALGLQLPFLEVLRVSRARTLMGDRGPVLSAPALTHVILGTFIPFAAPNLRYLVLHDLDIKLQPEHLANVLRTTPMLEELRLAWVTPERLVATSKSDDLFVTLPRLATAHFIGTPLSLAYAGSLYNPLDAELRFDISNDALTQSGAILPLLDALTPHLRNPSINSISFNPDHDVEVCLASLSPIASDGRERVRRVFLKVGHMSNYDGTLRGPLDFLSQITRRMDVGNLAFLHAYPFARGGRHGAHPDPALYTSQAEGVLQQLSTTTSLSLAWMPARPQPFLSALGANLDTIEILVVRSDDMLVTYDSLHPMSGDRIIVTAAEGVQTRWKEIVDALERRAAGGGQPLKRLVLEGLLGETVGPDVRQHLMVSLVSSFVGEVIDKRRCL